MRALAVVDARDAPAVFAALGRAIAGDGPAILPNAGAAPTDLPSEVERRVALVIETSGSTGRPKRVALSADALLANAAATEATLGGPGQWLLALPTNYIAGAGVLVRSLTAETEPLVLADGPFRAEAFVAAAERLEHATRYTSLVPAQLARILESEAATDAARRFDRILVGGQAVPRALVARAHEAGLRVTTTYGSSESSGGCVYDGRPIGQTRVEVVGGRIRIAGPVLAEGYLGDPERTARAFEHDGAERWYLTDDTGSFDDGVLRVTGRVDDIIVSGGIKVSLGEVEAVVRSIDALADAIVTSAPSLQWGAVPVVVATRPFDLDTVRDLVAAALGRAAAPARLVVVRELPLLANGKPDRAAVARLALQ